MEAIIPILIPVTYSGLMLIERLFPARALPPVRRWYLKGIVFFVIVMIVSALTPALVAEAVGEWSPLGSSSLGVLGGAVVTILVSELMQYLLHRSFHTSKLLWLWVHQLHHSAERLDVPGSAYTHPLEVMVGGVFGTLATVALGVSPDAAALAGFFGVFNAIFQHTNIRTPRWLGYIIQRPESHSVHHARDVHAYNYANLPLMDLIFGTFRNPADFEPTQGFWDGASRQLASMLTGRDVSRPASKAHRPVSSGSAIAAG